MKLTRPFVVMMLLCLVVTSHAAPKPKPVDEIDPRLCEMVTRHTPDADVAYLPGIDVDGNKVAPADVDDSQQMQLPTRFEIPLTVQMTRLLNLDPNQPPINKLGSGTEIWLGTLTVDGDKVYYNGKPLTSAQQDNLAVLCLKQK